MAKVYVSSTIADLERERRVVLDWLRLARHQAVGSYLPGGEVVRDGCLADVAGCDLYVLVLGHRYGFQIGGQPKRRGMRMDSLIRNDVEKCTEEVYQIRDDQQRERLCVILQQFDLALRVEFVDLAIGRQRRAAWRES